MSETLLRNSEGRTSPNRLPKKAKTLLVGAALATFVAAGCSNDESTPNNPDTNEGGNKGNPGEVDDSNPDQNMTNELMFDPDKLDTEAKAIEALERNNLDLAKRTIDHMKNDENTVLAEPVLSNDFVRITNFDGAEVDIEEKLKTSNPAIEIVVRTPSNELDLFQEEYPTVNYFVDYRDANGKINSFYYGLSVVEETHDDSLTPDSNEDVAAFLDWLGDSPKAKQAQAAGYVLTNLSTKDPEQSTMVGVYEGAVTDGANPATGEAVAKGLNEINDQFDSIPGLK